MSDLLERQLLSLSRRIDVEVEERMVEAVRRRLASEQIGEGGGPGRRWLAIAGMAVAASLAAVVAIPGSRNAVADWFGIGSTRIERTPGTAEPAGSAPALDDPDPTSHDGAVTSPASTSASSTSPATSTTGEAEFPSSLDLGPPLSSDEARRISGIGVPFADRLGTPSGIFVVRPPASGQVVVVYPPSPTLPASPVAGVGALLSAVPGQLHEELFVKVAGKGTVVESLTMTVASGATVQAIWLSGEPHEYAIEDADGEVLFDSLRLATNTLLWMQDGIVLRLESDLTRAGAIAVAETVTLG